MHHVMQIPVRIHAFAQPVGVGRPRNESLAQDVEPALTAQRLRLFPQTVQQGIKPFPQWELAPPIRARDLCIEAVAACLKLVIACHLV